MTREEKRKRIRDRVHSFSSYNNVPLVIDQLSDRNLRVAVYARVAVPSPDQVTSYELQTDHFVRLIETHENWALVDIYKDEGYSKNRKELSRMIEDCKAGKIDCILTKSVSRLSRNLEELLWIVKTLTELDPPVGVLFETENIYTLDNPEWEKLKAVSALAEEECRMKACQHGERMYPGRWSGTPMPPEAKSLLGYKTAEKKGEDTK